MKEKQDYIQDIVEMRTMMERSSKFLSVSGLAGILVGIYALLGAFSAYYFLGFSPERIEYNQSSEQFSFSLIRVIILAISILVLAIATAVFLSYRKANKRHEKFWNPTARRLLFNMSVPLFTGGILVLILISKGLIGLIAPFTLVFYGLALYNASKFTYEEVRSLGLIEVGLGLVSTYLIEYGIIFWALGFGIAHIVYGVYMHYRYER